MHKKGSLLQWLMVAFAALLLLITSGLIGVLLLVRLESPQQTSSPTAQPTAAAAAAPALVTFDNGSAPTATVTALAAAKPDATPTIAASPTSPPPPAYEPLFESAACPVDTPADATVECGYLTVPEDRSNPDGPGVRLAVAIIRSFSDTPAPDPVFYLAGGPGGNALGSLETWTYTGFADQRDVVVLAQRGTGPSEPSLNCWEVSDWTQRYMASPEGLLKSQMLRCHNRLVDEDINLRMYNSAANAADVEDLRRALGYEQVNLLGISYGTRLALTTMRDYPQHIRSVVLDSTYPPHVDSFAEHPANTIRSFDTLLDGCAADPSCNAAYPDLKPAFYALIDRLNAEPVNIEIENYFTDERIPITVSGNDVAGVLFLALYDTWIIPELPQMIYDASNGDYTLLSELMMLAMLQGYSSDGFSEGMFYSVQCYEEMPFTNESPIRASEDAYPEFQDYFKAGFEMDETLCRIWRVGEANPIENEPVQSDIPTLVLAGEYDPITPPEWGGRAAENLSNSYFYEFPGFGHGVSILGGCPTDITQAFLTSPATAPDTSCIANIGAPPFVLPDQPLVEQVPQGEPVAEIARVQNGGNLRGSPNLAPETVLGQVCPGDTVAVVGELQVGDILWKQVRIEATGGNCHAERVPPGTEGWISNMLLTWAP